MRIVKCPHCGTPFQVIPLVGLWPNDSEKGVNRHIAKCAKMPEKDRAYYYKNRAWPRSPRRRAATT